MSSSRLRGKVYRCPICGAEVGVLAHECGEFQPLCCNVEMVVLEHSLTFYVCPHCKAEVALVENKNPDAIAPQCCNVAMVQQGA
jgi:predicted RNA-binding Zn-ribbon protein involved in translation (DUF1610 family)